MPNQMSVLAHLNMRLDMLCNDDFTDSGDVPVDDSVLDEEVSSDAGIIQSQFQIWYNEMHSKQPKIPVLTTPITRQLQINNSYQACHLEPYVDKNGNIFPLNHIREIIPSANRYLRTCSNGKALKTYFATPLLSDQIELPNGVSIYDLDIEQPLATNAITEITNLYKKQVQNRDPRILMINPNTRPTNTLLFYSPGGEQPTFLDVIEILRLHTPNLAEYIMTYCRAIMSLFKINQTQLEKSQISLVRYDAMAGLNPHIDSIHQFDDTIGPIVTIAIGNNGKIFDMLPTLLPDTDNPVRIYSKPNQITIMDGMSRVAWSHALPWGYNCEQFTVAIKFPALPNPTRHEQFVYQGVTTQVPSYL